MSRSLDSDRVGGLIVAYSLPAIVSLVSNALYNAVDAAFVGRSGDGQLGLAALAAVFPLQMLFLGIGQAVGVGSGTLMGRRLGAGDASGAGRAKTAGLAAAPLLGLAAAVLVFLLRRPILSVVGGSGDAGLLAEVYLSVLLRSMPLYVLNIALMNQLRAQGAAAAAAVCSVLSALVNIPLDYVYVILWGRGVEGAAIATNIAVALGTAILAVATRFKASQVRFDLRGGLAFKDLKQIFGVGIAPFVHQTMTAVFYVILNLTSQAFGGSGFLALIGVVNRVYALVLMVLVGITQGTQPILSFNIGARRGGLTRRTFLLALGAACALVSFAYAGIALFARDLVSLFSKDAAFIEIGSSAIRIVLAACPVMALEMLASAYFQAAGKAKKSMFLELTRQCLVLLPLLFILPRFFRFYGLCFAFLAADVAGCVLAAILLSADTLFKGSLKGRAGLLAAKPDMT